MNDLIKKNEFFEEILSQPLALKKTMVYLQEEGQERFKELIDALRERQINRFIFTGMGSSFFSSYVPYYLLNQRGFLSEMREAGEFLLYSFPSIEKEYFKHVVIILISQSGESGEIIELIKKIKLLDDLPFLIGITNTPESTLALESDLTFLTKAGEEKSVTSKTYVSTLLLLFILAETISNSALIDDDILDDIEDLMKKTEVFLEEPEKFNIFYNNLLSFYGKEFKCLEILSRGPSLATAYQAALTFKEITKQYSEANPISTFNHGCIECLNSQSRLIILSSDQNHFNLNIHFIKKMLTNWDCGKIIHVTNMESDDPLLNNSPKVLTFKHDVMNPFLAPIMEIMILQLFFYKIAEKNNIVPGKFTFSEKITRDL